MRLYALEQARQRALKALGQPCERAQARVEVARSALQSAFGRRQAARGGSCSSLRGCAAVLDRLLYPHVHCVIPDGELALAGGSGRYAIGEEKLDLADLIGRVIGPEHGAVVTFTVVTFTGTVRGESHGKKVRRLEYEAYGAMALEQMEAIGADLERKWPGVRLAFHHRYGTLEVSEAAVIIAAAAPHRADAFRACEEAIDRLKRDAPIWKKEVFEDGAEWVGRGP